MAFAGAQGFFVDPSLVQYTGSISVSRVDLYFKAIPQATNNKSGINNPGVNIYLTGTSNNVPVLPTDLSRCPMARCEYNTINPSTDASLVTSFRFDPPVPSPTDSVLAFIVQFDGDEDFTLWTDVSGQYLVGTTTVSTGPDPKYIGGYYSFISGVPTVASNFTSNSTMIAVGTTSSNSAAMANNTYAAAAWNPVSGSALKFDVYVARYAVNGDGNLNNYTNNNSPSNSQIFSSVQISNTANGEIQFSIPQDRYEYLAYDRINSSVANIKAGERVFPILPLYPPGQAAKVTLNCVTGQTSITATGNVNFSQLMSIIGNQPETIVILSAGALGANADIVNVRTVTSIVSNTVITIDEPLTVTNAVATFWRAPIATVDQFKSARFFGSTQDVVVCKGSTANTNKFFTPHSVNAISINTGGTGYSNTDWVKVTGHIFLTNRTLNAYNANANILTNANGTITNIYLANVGSNFANIANVSYLISNSAGSNSVGTGANLSISIGTNIKGEFLGFNGKGGNFANVHPIDIAIGETMPGLLVTNPSGTYWNAMVRFPYYSVDDATVFSGSQAYCDPDGSWDVLNIETFSIHEPFEFSKRRIMPSWSRELYIPYANGSSSGGLGGTSNGILSTLTSNASVITLTTVSNNDFSAATFVPSGSTITFSRYIINNDATAENTNYGNAWARGVEVKFNMASNTLSEDLLVYATVYAPANTTVLAYAKIYNTHDNDSFDTKDWTMLQLRAGNNIVSSGTNLADVHELTWGFQQYPNVAFTITGSVTTTNGSKTLTGSNTNFSNLVSGDMIVIVNNLFPNLYQVAIANVITNATSMTINTPVSNLNLVGSGFIVSKLAYKFQAFNNGLNDNVVRYYSSTLVENDGFNSCALKLVLLAANGLSVPLVSDLRAVAVSA